MSSNAQSPLKSSKDRVLWTGDRMKISYCENALEVPAVLKILCVQCFFQWPNDTHKLRLFCRTWHPRTSPTKDPSHWGHVLDIKEHQLTGNQKTSPSLFSLHFDNSISSYYLGCTSSSQLQPVCFKQKSPHYNENIHLYFPQFCCHHLQLNTMQVPQSPKDWSFSNQSLTPEGLTGTAYLILP